MIKPCLEYHLDPNCFAILTFSVYFSRHFSLLHVQFGWFCTSCLYYIATEIHGTVACETMTIQVFDGGPDLGRWQTHGSAPLGVTWFSRLFRDLVMALFLVFEDQDGDVCKMMKDWIQRWGCLNIGFKDWIQNSGSPINVGEIIVRHWI